MNLTLQRLRQSPDGPTFGQIINEDGAVIVPATLELPDRGNEHGISRIPAGSYPAFRFNSPHIGYQLFQLANVPDRVGIDLHVGNTMQDTEGCILLGEARGDDELSITQSRVAFADFMQVMDGVDRFVLTVVDA